MGNLERKSKTAQPDQPVERKSEDQPLGRIVDIVAKATGVLYAVIRVIWMLLKSP